MIRIAALLLMVSGCGMPPASPDLAQAPDSAPGVDMAQASDLAMAPDLASSEDLEPALADLASAPDLAAAPDLAHAPADMARPPDLEPVADLKPLPDLEPVAFVLSHYGDSITAGSEYNPQTGIFQFDGGGYRSDEERSYAAMGWKVTEVGTHLGGPADTDNHNDGYPGYWIGDQGCPSNTSCYAAIVSTLPCGDEINLMLGTNDLRQGAGVALMTSRINGLLDEVHAHCPNARIMVMTVASPAGAVTDTYNHTTLPAAVAARPYTTYCDVSHNLVMPDDFAPDKIHPLTQGYAKIAANEVACRKALEH